MFSLGLLHVHASGNTLRETPNSVFTNLPSRCLNSAKLTIKPWGGYQGWSREAEDSWERRGVEQRTLNEDRDISCPGVTEGHWELSGGMDFKGR